MNPPKRRRSDRSISLPDALNIPANEEEHEPNVAKTARHIIDELVTCKNMKLITQQSEQKPTRGHTKPLKCTPNWRDRLRVFLQVAKSMTPGAITSMSRRSRSMQSERKGASYSGITTPQASQNSSPACQTLEIHLTTSCARTHKHTQWNA